MSATNILDEYYHHLIQFIQSYGWFILFSAILYYNYRPHINKYLETRSLAEANDPKRCSILNAQKRKIREEQQRKLAEKVL